MDLTIEQLKVIEEETLRVYPEEAVIVIDEHNNAIALKNIHNDPINHFKVNPEEFFKYKPKALIHSHTLQTGDNPSPDPFVYYDPRTPSAADMALQFELDIPFGIVAYDGETLMPILWFPDLDKPLLGREYIYGVYDCYSLIRSYYWQNYGVKLIDKPRVLGWWEPMTMYEQYVDDSGFVEIREQDLREGDIIFIKIKDVECHALLYIGNNQVIHHVVGKLSVTELYNKYKTRISRWFTHIDKPKDREYNR